LGSPALEVDLRGFDSSDEDCCVIQTVDLPEKVIDDIAELNITPPQSAEWTGVCAAYLDRQIYTIDEETEASLSLELRTKRGLYQLALRSQQEGA
jgi:hypothetical protein